MGYEVRQTPFNFIKEAKKRDEALDLLEETRAYLIDRAKFIAHDLVRKNGQVTSPEVIDIMIDSGLGHKLKTVDRRFMGAVFRKNKGWIRIGFVNKGSHNQPISVWRLK